MSGDRPPIILDCNTMTLNIRISPDFDEPLKREACAGGKRDGVAATQLVVECLPPARPAARDQATLDLLAEWDREDATEIPPSWRLANGSGAVQEGDERRHAQRPGRLSVI